MSGGIWGIDLGGTKIEAVVLPGSGEAKPLVRRRLDTEASHGYQHILDRVAQLVTAMKDETGLTPAVIGVGHPGVLDPQTSKIKNSNTRCLNGEKLGDDLAALLGAEIRCANDANCFALAEATLGAARGCETVFGVILGTGVGGGAVIRGSVLHGAQGIGGEWGHNVLIPFGPPCYCGKNGCVETILSGPALEAYYTARSGRSQTLQQIAAAAETGDPDAKATIDRLSLWFGRAIGVVVNILDPGCIVLGGGVSNVDALCISCLDELRRTIFNDRLETRIVRNELGDSAGVFGAAMLCR